MLCALSSAIENFQLFSQKKAGFTGCNEGGWCGLRPSQGKGGQVWATVIPLIIAPTPRVDRWEVGSRLKLRQNRRPLILGELRLDCSVTLALPCSDAQLASIVRAIDGLGPSSREFLRPTR